MLDKIYAHFLEKRRAQNLAKRADFALEIPILSVGNLTTGGTGKTPAVQWLARFLAAQNSQIGIAARGYKGEKSGIGALVCDGKTVFESAKTAGDEAILHARNLPGAVVAIAAQREKAVEICVQNGAQVVILDDGFQFWSLPRRFDLVLLDAQKPFGPNEKLLPLGRLREEPQALGRADAILFTRSENADKTALETRVRRFCDAPIFWSVHAPRDLKNEQTGEIVPLEWLRNREIEAIAGLADNAQFFDSLQKLGAKIRAKHEGKDHQNWSGQERENQKFPAVTTEKDAVKMRFNSEELPVFSLRIALQIERESELQSLILGKLGRSCERNFSCNRISCGS